MAVRIRLKRMGRKNRPFFRIGAFDVREERDGRCIENLGYYNPIEKDEEKKLVLKKERIEYWISVGAKPTESAAVFLRKHHIPFKK